MGVPKISEILTIDYCENGGNVYTSFIPTSYFDSNKLTLSTEGKSTWAIYFYNEDKNYISGLNNRSDGATVTLVDNSYCYFTIYTNSQTVGNIVINGENYILGNNTITYSIPDREIREPYTQLSISYEEGTGLKALIDWVDGCTDEEFVRDFEQHFHKDYTLRYFCLVTLIGAVDNLGNNMMLDTADNKI